MKSLSKSNINLINITVFLLIIQLQLHPLLPDFLRLTLSTTLSLILLILAVHRNNYKIINLKFFIWWIGFLFIALVSVFFTVSADESIGRILSLILSLIFLGAISQYTRTKKDIYRILNYFIFGGTLFISLVFINNLNKIMTGSFSSLSFGMEYTYVSLQTLCIVIWKLVYQKGNIFLYYTLSIFILFMNFISGNKKVMIIPIVFIIVLLTLKNRNRVFKNLLYLILIMIILLVGYQIIMENTFFYNVIGYRVEGLLNYFTGEGRIDGSTRTRFGLLNEAFSVVKEHPIIGVGLGAFRTINTYQTYAHNNYLELLSGTGILGLIAFYWIFLYLLIYLMLKMKTIKDPLIPLLIALIVSLLVHDLGTVSYYRTILTLFVCISICYMNILQKDLKDNYLSKPITKKTNEIYFSKTYMNKN